MFLKIIVLVALLKLLTITENPILCSSIYTGIALFFGLIFGTPITTLAVGVIMAFALSSLYFFLLNRFSDGWQYWVIMICGLLIGLV